MSDLRSMLYHLSANILTSLSAPSPLSLLEDMPWIRAGWRKLYLAIKERSVLNGNLYKRLDIPGFSADLVSWVNAADGATMLDLQSKVVPGANSNLEIHDRSPELIRMR